MHAFWNSSRRNNSNLPNGLLLKFLPLGTDNPALPPPNTPLINWATILPKISQGTNKFIGLTVGDIKVTVLWGLSPPETMTPWLHRQNPFFSSSPLTYSNPYQEPHSHLQSGQNCLQLIGRGGLFSSEGFMPLPLLPPSKRDHQQSVALIQWPLVSRPCCAADGGGSWTRKTALYNKDQNGNKTASHVCFFCEIRSFSIFCVVLLWKVSGLGKSNLTNGKYEGRIRI